MLFFLAIFPLVAGIVVYGTGTQSRRHLAGIGVATMGVTALAATSAAAFHCSGTLGWGAALQISAALTPLSAVVAVTVPAVALPILLYAAAHEHGPGVTRLVALLLAFVGAMELLVIAADLLTLLIGWELVGACSWALIGHRWREVSNPKSGLYAFVMTRFGDLGLFLAAMAAFAGTGSFAYAELGRLDGALLHVLVFGVLLSAAAKSGQVPFAPWLFRAMAGPTSVSALLHAATMVAAGAYLLARLHPMLDRAEWFAPAVIAIGLVTALTGGLVAVLQGHAKKLLAASTSAHFGLMFVAVGAGYPAVAILHLVTHAGFKALLFLGAGIAGQRADGFALERMGFGRALPWVAVLSAVGGLALAGVPPLGGAWTKEAVAAAAGHASPWAASAVIVAGGLSAAYAARFQLLAFGFGEDASPAPPHRLETLALALLAAASLLLSALWLPGVQDAVAAWLGSDLPESRLWEWIASLLTVAAGLYAGRLLADRYPGLGATPVVAGVANWFGLPGLIDFLVIRPTLLIAGCAAWIDDAVLDAPPRGAALLARTRVLARIDDVVVDALPRSIAVLGRSIASAGVRFGERLTDGLPEGVARLVGFGGGDARRLQTGLSHHYYVMVTAGAVVLVGILIAWS